MNLTDKVQSTIDAGIRRYSKATYIVVADIMNGTYCIVVQEPLTKNIYCLLDEKTFLHIRNEEAALKGFLAGDPMPRLETFMGIPVIEGRKDLAVSLMRLHLKEYNISWEEGND